MNKGKESRQQGGTALCALALALAAQAARAETPAAASPAPVEPTAANAAAGLVTVKTATLKPLVYRMSINGLDVGDAALLQLPNGRLLARVNDLKRWKLKTLEKPEFYFSGEPYQALDSLPEYRIEVDESRQAATLNFQTQAFTGTVIDTYHAESITAQKPQGLGGYLNYELVAAHQDARGASNATILNGDLEAVAFNPLGVLTSEWLGLNLSADKGDAGAISAAGKRHFVRLQTTFTHDMPETLTQLTLGDAIGSSSLYGRPVRFGGLRWSRNFGTQPGYAILPQTAINGETALPSVLDLYVDGVRQSSQQIPPGPFQISSLPVFSGGGEVEVVVRDLLGREQLIHESYFTNGRQLRAGLDEFGYEAGFVRNRFGTESENYGQFVAAGTHRYGFTDKFTGEFRGEFLGSGLQTLGTGGILTVLPIGVFSAAAALSHSDPGYGGLGLLSFDRSLRRGLSLGARAQFTTSDFRQLGLSGTSAAPTRVLAANLGYTWQRVVNMGVSYFNILSRTPSRVTSGVTGTVSTRFHYGSVALTTIERIEPDQDLTLLLNYSFRFFSKGSAALGTTYNRNAAGEYRSQEYARVQQNSPQGQGWGYRAEVRGNQGDRFDSTVSENAEVGLNGPYGSYALEGFHDASGTAWRGTVSGSLATFAEHVFLSRKINSSFAVIETGVPELPISVYSQISAVTDANGVALVPDLRAYQANDIRLDTNNLPLDYIVPFTEVQAAPYFRSGVLLAIPGKRSLSATAAFTQANGRPVPAGATLQLLGGDHTEFGVGKNGEAFITGLKVGENVAQISWAGMMCTISFTVPENAGFQPNIGPFQCMENPE